MRHAEHKLVDRLKHAFQKYKASHSSHVGKAYAFLDNNSRYLAEPELIYVQTETVSCDAGGGLGHPRVFLNVGDKGVICPYCSRCYAHSAS